MNISLPPNGNKCYDNTRISAYKECPRKYFLRHQMHWTGVGTALALTFGQSWHNGQDIIWTYAQKFDSADLATLAGEAFDATWKKAGLDPNPGLTEIAWMKPRTPQIAKEMFWEYTHNPIRAKMIKGSEVLAVEQPFAVPIPGMDGFWYIGRLDKAIAYNGQRLILEHKTTTAYATVGNFRSDYVDSWYISSQVFGYQFGGNLYYDSIDAVWVDAALVHAKIHDAFKFIPIAHNYVLLKEWLDGTKAWIQQIHEEEEAFKEAGQLLPGMFKKNTESCFGKYGTCPYLDICRSVADPSALAEVPPGFVEEKWEPFNVLGLNKLVEETDNASQSPSST